MFTPTYHQRNLERLNELAPVTKQKAMDWYNYCIKNGIDVLITETRRTEEQQRKYVAEGKSKTMRSYHLVGQALDFVPIINGKADYNAYSNPKIQQTITYAKQLGFSWGGDWKGAWDKPHLQYDKIGYGQDVEKQPVSKVEDDKAIVPYPGNSLKLGSKGKDVERIQRTLGINVDGVFGKETEAAVKAYQKRKGLTVDGIVGQQTWNVLFKERGNHHESNQ